MHKFLRAIGFSHITKEQLQHIFADIISAPTVQKAALDSEGNEFAELSKEYGDFFGISVRGVYNEDDTFEMEYYYPYLCGKNISTIEPAEVEKHAEKESYAGICDEVRIGVTLIFYLQNVVDYLAVSKSKGYMNLADGVILAALSTEGKILFPINKAEKKVPHAPKEGTDRNHLIAAARDGDEDAIESLTIDDMDTYSMISKRVTKEDVYSIVKTTFMPYGIESDKFAVIIGPCSADNQEAVEDYVGRLARVQEEVKDKLFIIPRVYTNKPRTTGKGYKGMLHQPDPEKKPDLLQGLITIRQMFLKIMEDTGFPLADEMLYPENYRYLSDLLS